MSKLDEAAEALHGYLLREESFERLEQVRNQMYLMATIAFAATEAEDQEPLQIRRAVLGQCFESIGLQLDEVLSTVEWLHSKRAQAQRRH